MYILADSSSTRTEWVIVDGGTVVEHATTAGLNPYFNTRREISHIIRLQLPDAFFRGRPEHVYFYGAGCASDERNKIVESSLVAQFKTHATVMSDLIGAARGMLLDKPGLVAILSTGANSCLYDGHKIVLNVRPGGYILGDEGSNSYFGKMLLSDIIKGIAPSYLIRRFYERFDTNVDEVMDRVYSQHPNNALAEYSFFLAENLDVDYCREMVYYGFINFFRRNIAPYDFRNNPLSVVGSTPVTYREIFEAAARDFGVRIVKIEKSSVPGLVQYHGLSKDDKISR